MEKKRKNRLQSSWLQQAQAVSREQGRKTAQPNGPNRVKSGHSGASRNFVFQQTDVSRVTSVRPTSLRRCITPPSPPARLESLKIESPRSTKFNMKYIKDINKRSTLARSLFGPVYIISKDSHKYHLA